VIERGKPFLGICVGSQLMAERGVEKETTDGLGWIGGEVVEITPADHALKVPHMGWNTLDVRREHPLLAGIPPARTGSTPISCTPSISVLRMKRTWWLPPITAAGHRGGRPRHFAGTQFHRRRASRWASPC
jgi:glutamine amidotransferase